MTEVATVLPNELRLGAPPTMPQARSYMFRQQSTLQTYNDGNQIQINIPRLQRSYLRKDSYLRFNVDITETGPFLENSSNTLTLDSAGAFGFIQKIEVFDYLGSTVLESISEVPQLMALLLDMGVNIIDHGTNGQTSLGLEQNYSSSDSINFTHDSTSSTTPITSTSTQMLTQNRVRSATSGMTIPSYGNNSSSTILTTSSTYARYYTAEFSIPLPSFLGFLSKKMVPLHNGFTILLTLASTDVAVFTPGKSVNTPYIQINSEVIDTIAAGQVTSASTVGQYCILKYNVANNPLFAKGTVLTIANITPSTYNGTVVVTESSTTADGVSHQINYLPVGATPTTAATVVNTATIVTTSGHAELGGHNPKPYNTIVSASTTTYKTTVSEVYMECQILELGPIAESMILSSTGGQPLVVHTKSFRSYVGNVLAGAQEFVLNMNLNVASMTNILWFMRSSKQVSGINYQCVGNRTRNMLQRWFFQYGSTSLPQNNGIQTMGTSYPSTASTSALKYLACDTKGTEGYNELMKARPVDITHSKISHESYFWDNKWGGRIVSQPNAAASTDVAGMGNILNLNSFSFPSNRPLLYVGKFAAGLNLELANGKSGDLISGLNTNGMNTSIRGVFHPLFTSYMDPDGVRVDAYAEYDAFINISPGIATTVSF